MVLTKERVDYDILKMEIINLSAFVGRVRDIEPTRDPHKRSSDG